jgi:hypothetical protein
MNFFSSEFKKMNLPSFIHWIEDEKRVREKWICEGVIKDWKFEKILTMIEYDKFESCRLS